MRSIDRSKLAKAHRGKWVALKSDRKTVVGSGSSVRGALQAAKKKGYEQPIITRIPKELRHFVGFHQAA